MTKEEQLIEMKAMYEKALELRDIVDDNTHEYNIDEYREALSIIDTYEQFDKGVHHILYPNCVHQKLEDYYQQFVDSIENLENWM